jgi:hypothetical protein
MNQIAAMQRRRLVYACCDRLQQQEWQQPPRKGTLHVPAVMPACRGLVVTLTVV